MGKLNIDKLNEVVNYFDINTEEYTTFIESGTYLGETVESMCNYFDSIHSVEISEYLYKRYLSEHEMYEHIKIHLGDSGKVIPDIIKNLDANDKCVFWLDGHYSSGMTSKGDKDCPLIEECCGIDLNYKSNQGLILIDDLRLFGTNITENWEDINIENIVKCFEYHTIKLYEHPDDMLCIYIEKKQ